MKLVCQRQGNDCGIATVARVSYKSALSYSPRTLQEGLTLRKMLSMLCTLKVKEGGFLLDSIFLHDYILHVVCFFASEHLRREGVMEVRTNSNLKAF